MVNHQTRDQYFPRTLREPRMVAADLKGTFPCGASHQYGCQRSRKQSFQSSRDAGALVMQRDIVFRANGNLINRFSFYSFYAYWSEITAMKNHGAKRAI